MFMTGMGSGCRLPGALGGFVYSIKYSHIRACMGRRLVYRLGVGIRGTCTVLALQALYRKRQRDSSTPARLLQRINDQSRTVLGLFGEDPEH